MKVVSAVRRRCQHCRIVRKNKTIYVRCEVYPRHKQRQGFATLVQPSACPAPGYCEEDGYRLLVMNAFFSTLIR